MRIIVNLLAAALALTLALTAQTPRLGNGKPSFNMKYSWMENNKDLIEGHLK